MRGDPQARFLRVRYTPAAPPPRRAFHVVEWSRQNLFSGIGNSALTLGAAALIAWAAYTFVDFAILSAAPPDGGVADCRARPSGACWPFIAAKLDQFVYGRYPVDQRWRIDLAGALLVAAVLFLVLARGPWRSLAIATLAVLYPLTAVTLLSGGVPGLPYVETALWGGLSLTIIISLFGMAASLPLGVLLALGRRSSWPIVRVLSIIFIEFWRGVPLITVLFMASVMLPLFLPAGVTIDKLLRALIAVALFSAAYMAEVVRGGLQSIPKGQYDAAFAVGLSWWQSMRLIILPQALANVIPAIVNNFTALLKETTLVLIIGLFDFLGMIQLGLTDTSWASPSTAYTGYLFAAMVFWVLCFGLSRYAASIERGLARSRRSAGGGRA